jgi:hypothetical protein
MSILKNILAVNHSSVGAAGGK